MDNFISLAFGNHAHVAIYRRHIPGAVDRTPYCKPGEEEAYLESIQEWCAELLVQNDYGRHTVAIGTGRDREGAVNALGLTLTALHASLVKTAKEWGCV